MTTRIRGAIVQHGPAALDALEGLADRYGEAAFKWALARIKARLRKRLAKTKAEAIADLEARTGLKGAGHP